MDDSPPLPALAADARSSALAYDRGELRLDDDTLDRVLGMECSVRVALGAEDGDIDARHPAESVAHLATPYAACRAFLHAVNVEPDDVVIDLGSGFGRFVVYGALTTPARFRGIELLADRAAIASRWVERLRLSRAEIVEGNVLDQPLDDGTIYYAFRPFSVETEQLVVARLHAMAALRPITVGAFRLMPGLFDDQLFDCADHGDMRIFRSRPR